MNESELWASVDETMIKNIDNPEKIINYFLKHVVLDFKSLGDMEPGRMLIIGEVIPFKDRLLKYLIQEIDSFINRYNDLVEEKYNFWLSINKRWHSISPVDIKKILEDQSEDFRESGKMAFHILRNTSRLHRKNATFIIADYDITRKELDTLDTLIKKLDKIGDLTYEKFLISIKNGKIPYVN